MSQTKTSKHVGVGFGSGHVTMNIAEAASYQENVAKDHRITGRSKIFDELRKWPTTSSQARNAFEGYNKSSEKIKESLNDGKGGQKGTPPSHTPSGIQARQGILDRRHFHVSDDLLQHYESGLKTNMKPR
uniref:Uncharacterized protein n=1 Tax=Cryptomonas curvata TaxID=233186 RepID=A0A7S0N3U6_9CRYP|mmetsp:Transcript_6275/g.13787  ORF Transcript_6275/g.13787 Transcript_6275/m.13787 type:complete len:130 (+) Transcript_6275:3-392(+)